MKILHSSDLHGSFKKLLNFNDFDVWVDTGDFFPNRTRGDVGVEKEFQTAFFKYNWPHPKEVRLEEAEEYLHHAKKELNRFEKEYSRWLATSYSSSKTREARKKWETGIAHRNEKIWDLERNLAHARDDWRDAQKKPGGFKPAYSIGKTLTKWLDGRPLISVPGNHDYVSLANLMKQSGARAYSVTPKGVKVDGVRYSGFREVPWIHGEWAGETQQGDFGEVVEEVFAHPPDILLTHAGPANIMTGSDDWHGGINTLATALSYKPHKIKAHFFGHDHDYGSQTREVMGVLFSNSATKPKIVTVPGLAVNNPRKRKKQRPAKRRSVVHEVHILKTPKAGAHTPKKGKKGYQRREKHQKKMIENPSKAFASIMAASKASGGWFFKNDQGGTSVVVFEGPFTGTYAFNHPRIFYSPDFMTIEAKGPALSVWSSGRVAEVLGPYREIVVGTAKRLRYIASKEDTWEKLPEWMKGRYLGGVLRAEDQWFQSEVEEASTKLLIMVQSAGSNLQALKRGLMEQPLRLLSLQHGAAERMSLPTQAKERRCFSKNFLKTWSAKKALQATCPHIEKQAMPGMEELGVGGERIRDFKYAYNFVPSAAQATSRFLEEPLVRPGQRHHDAGGLARQRRSQRIEVVEMGKAFSDLGVPASYFRKLLRTKTKHDAVKLKDALYALRVKPGRDHLRTIRERHHQTEKVHEILAESVEGRRVLVALQQKDYDRLIREHDRISATERQAIRAIRAEHAAFYKEKERKELEGLTEAREKAGARFVYPKGVKALTGEECFLAEGEELGHCVAGFYRKRSSLTFSLRGPKGCQATAEIGVKRGDVIQFYGPLNAPPAEECKTLLGKFLSMNEAELEKMRGEGKPMINPRRNRVRFNPARDVFDPTEEQKRAQVQGIYESEVRRMLGLPYTTPFRDSKGKRLDVKHGVVGPSTWGMQGGHRIKYGSRDYLEKARDRYRDVDHLIRNRQDYEETLALQRKGGFYRVLQEPTKDGLRFSIWPMPPGIELPMVGDNASKAKWAAEMLNQQHDPRRTGKWWKPPRQKYTRSEVDYWLPPASAFKS